MANVVVAPDSFKGSIDAAEAAAAIAQGWLAVRPGDTVSVLPQADGGEGTLDAIRVAVSRAAVIGDGGSTSGSAVVQGPVSVTGPDGSSVEASWLLLSDGTAVVELAHTAGLPLMEPLDATGATTWGLGELLNHVLDAGARRLVVGLGGSATTDGAAGAFAALGLTLRGGGALAGSAAGGSAAGDGSRERIRMQDLAATLDHLDSVDATHLRPPPPDGVELLTDVDAPLLGPRGAAAVFAPQKGASPAQVVALEARLTHWARALEATKPPESTPAHAAADALHVDTHLANELTEAPGAGAAGGAGYGFMALWGATATPGAERVARLTGLDTAMRTADVLVTGEGKFDATSLTGKVVGHGLRLAHSAGAHCIVVAGVLAMNPSHLVDSATGSSAAGNRVTGLSLVDLAGSPAEAMTDPARWLREAGSAAARRYSSGQ